MPPSRSAQLRAARSLAIAIVVALILLPAVGRAQVIELRAPGARAIVGVVTDSAGRALDSAEIVISSLKRSTIAGADGQFQFGDINRGTYAVSARRIGYFPQVRQVTVSDEGGIARFAMVPLTRVLPLVVTTATRGGLSGVVADTADNTVAGAQVYSVAVSTIRAVTDSAGQFFLDLRPGRHMIRIRKAGYGSRMMTVSIPRDSGRQIFVNLALASRGSTAREETALKAFRERMLFRSPVYSTFWTREDLKRFTFKELTSLVNAAAGQPVDEACMAYIDGGPMMLPIYTLKAAGIEALEVYAGSRTTRGARSSNQARSGPGSRVVPRGPSGCVQVYVWLRK